MRIIFAGTSDFAVTCLQALLAAAYKIVAVYTQPDRPSGRGRRLLPSPVKQLSLRYALPIYQPASLCKPEVQLALRHHRADIMVVVAYGLLLPSAVLTIPPYGCINVHASLLPRWRGAAPIARTLLAGDSETGITVIQMNEKLDDGAILYQRHCSILMDDTSRSLQQRLAVLGAEALLQTLIQLANGQLAPQEQPVTGRCYAKKLVKSEAVLDWQRSAAELARQVRAFNPWPVAFSFIGKHVLRIWQATVNNKSVDAPPGTIIRADRQGIEVATGQGHLCLMQIQLAGGRRLPVSEILHAKSGLFQSGILLGGACD